MITTIRYPILATIFKPFCKKHKYTLALVSSAIIEANTAGSTHVAARLADWLGILPTSALNRFYRLLSNHRIDELLLSKQLLNLMRMSLGNILFIVIDLTEWHHNLRMLVAAVVSDKRAIPIQTAAFHKSNIPRSQNSRENGFTNTLSMLLGELGIKAVILADRGFRRVSWLKLLQTKKLDFVVRLQQDVYAQARGLGPRLLSNIGLKPGQAIDVKWVELRQDQDVRVRFVGVWKRGASEPWWLATSLKNSVEKNVSFYDRRMTIEEQFRDTKGCRFGVKLYWTQLKKPEHLSRFALLVGIAIFVWTAIGVAATWANPSLRFIHPKKGPRFSFVTIGMRSRHLVMRQFPLNARNLTALIPKPSFRSFPWIRFRVQTI